MTPGMADEEHFKSIWQGAAAGKDWREHSRQLTGFCAIARALRRVPRHNLTTDAGTRPSLPNANVGGLMAEAEAKDVHFLQSDGGSVIPASLRRHAPVTALPGPRKPAFLALESRANVSGESYPAP